LNDVLFLWHLHFFFHHLGEVDSKHVTFQICDALAYIHSKGVTHRDLKPENILLTRQNPPIVKVADFGLAKVVDSLTMLRTMCGTPSYLAPEVVKQNNAEGYDNLVDSWSVGVIVFSMLTNAGPFIEDENQRDIRARILDRKIDWNTLFNRNLSEEAYTFIRGLLREDPLQRLSLTNALDHPWLLSYTPVYPSERRPEKPIMSRNGQSVTRAGVTEDFIGMQLQESTLEGTPRTAPLQRRSLVLSEAAETGNHIPEPSWEMIAFAASQDKAGGSSSTAKGANKRLRAELSPLSEEVLDDAGMDGLSSDEPSTSGRGRIVMPPADEDSSNGRPRRSTRRMKVARRD